MNAPKKQYRKKRLFPRTLDDVMKEAMKPMMSNQGKIYAALLRDWPRIVGNDRAAICKPERLQFTNRESQEATLHLAVRPAAAPELTYITEQLIEQCARYFGYRAINRIVIHASHGIFDKQESSEIPASPPQHPQPAAPLPEGILPEMRDVFSRIAAHIGSGVVKKDETR